MIRLSISAAITLVALSLTLPAQAQDKEALAGLQELKIAFDVTNGTGKFLLKDLEVIDETRQSLIKQGVKPEILIAFRGPATKLVQTDQTKIKTEDREIAKQIAAKIAELKSAQGITAIEQCSVAVRLSETKSEDVVPGITVVGNGWISLAAYQAKGYRYIAAD